jgi:hypothetical protein
VRISANSIAISVIGFCRPVRTLASLIGVASGRYEDEMRTRGDAVRGEAGAGHCEASPE